MTSSHLARIIALSVVFFSLSAEGIPLQLRPWRKGAIQFNNETSYFSSSANYLERGEYEDLPNGSFSAIESELSGRYHLSRSISAYTGGSLASVSADKAGVVRENIALTRFFFGGDFAILRKPFFLVGEAEGSLSLSTVDPGTDEAITSDGAHFLSARLIGSKRFSWFEIFGTLGLKYRTEGLSSLLTWNLAVQKNLGKFDVGFGAAGFESLTGDDQTELERAVVTTRVNAGSLRYYSHNPALMELRLFASWMLSRAWTINFALSQTINGANSAAGTMGTVGVTLSLPPSKTSPSQPSTGGKKSIVDEFEIDTQEVDPELFKEDE